MVRQQIFAAADWDPVTPGSLNGLASRIRSRRRRKKVARVVVPLAAVLLVGSLLPFLADPSTESQPHSDGIACREVRSNLDSFMAEDLDQGRMAAMKTHLKECPQCRRRMEALLKPEVASNNTPNPEFFTLGLLDHSPAVAGSVKCWTSGECSRPMFSPKIWRSGHVSSVAKNWTANRYFTQWHHGHC